LLFWVIVTAYFDENIFRWVIFADKGGIGWRIRRRKMAKRTRKARKPGELGEFVVIAFAEDLQEAKNYKTLLETDGITAVIKEREGEILGSRDIAVMVPEDCFDQAHVIIESQNDYDDFYDLALEEEDESNADDVYFPEGF